MFLCTQKSAGGSVGFEVSTQPFAVRLRVVFSFVSPLSQSATPPGQPPASPGAALQSDSDSVSALTGRRRAEGISPSHLPLQPSRT